jgi:predicted metal-dependent hydrolase
LNEAEDMPLTRNPDVAFRELAEGEAVLLHLVSGSYHGVNAVGALVWGLVDGDRTATDVVAAVREQVEDPPDSLEAEVRAFIADLRERDLLS